MGTGVSTPSKRPLPSSLITFYLLKVTKFLGKKSQFEFLVMTVKNIFAYKLIWSLNISDFNLFYVKVAPPSPPVPPRPPPREKSHPPLSQQPPLKVEVLSNPPFLKIWLEAQPPLQKKKGGGGG